MKLDFRQKSPLIPGTIALALISLTHYAWPQGAQPVDADATIGWRRGCD